MKPDPIPGMSIDGYEVIRSLGSGGMAHTWLCRLRGHRGFTRRVVVKTLKAEFLDDPNFHSMFLDEARIGATLEHPNIPRVERFSTIQDMPYMVQEYVEGPRLTEVINAMRRRGHLDVPLACRIVSDVARALDYVHHAVGDDGRPLGLVHRDVSTSNVLVSVRGKTKLIDFGVAFFDDREAMTEVGFFKGKLQYMAPECMLGSGTLTPASDVFSLGVVLYAVITGKFPWRRDAPLAAQLGNFPPPAQRNPNVWPGLDALVLQMVASEGAQRPTAAQVSDQLLALIAKHGPPVTDDVVSARVEALFPGGYDDWAPHHQVDTRSLSTMTMMHPELTGSMTPRPVRRGGWMAIAFASSFAATLVTLLLAGVIWWWTSQNAGTGGGMLSEASVLPLLDEAEQMIGQSNARAALDVLEQARSIGSSDADLLIRMSRLASEARRQDYRQTATMAFERGRDDDARQAVYALLAEFPSDAQGLAWLDKIRPLPQAARRDTPGPKPGRLVVVSTPGALLTIDGTPLGTVPQVGNQRLPAGRYRVSLRKEGFREVERTLSLRAGETYTLELALEAAEDEEIELAAAAPEARTTPEEAQPGAAEIQPAEVAAPGEAPPEGQAPVDEVPFVRLDVKQRVQLSFPDEARGLDLSKIRCTAHVQVDERGLPTDVRVIPDEACPESFQATTQAGLMKWRWYPLRDGKERIRAQTRIRVNYDPDR